MEKEKLVLDINGGEKMNVDYHWYHHAMPNKDRENIQRCIDTLNYFDFLEYYKKYNAKGLQEAKYNEEFECLCPIVYLPKYAIEWDPALKIYKNINILERENFMKITFSECECG